MRQKFLLASENPGPDILFDVLAYIVFYFIVVEDVISFINPKTVKKDKVKLSHVSRTK